MSRRCSAVLAVLVLAVPALAQKDRVFFRDRAANKEDRVDGDVTESAAGVKVTSAPGKDRFIPATDLIRVDYGALEPSPGQNAVAQTEGKTAAEALKYYADLAKTVAGGNERAKRYVLFREAYWQAEVAGEKQDKEFAEEGKKAADKLAAFVKAYPKSWEQWPAARQAARLYGELKDWKAADAVLADLGAAADLTVDLKLDVKLTRVGYMLRAGNYADAKSLNSEAEGDKAATGGLKDRAAIYKEALAVLPAKDGPDADPNDPSQKKKVTPTDAVNKIQKLIDASKDPAARGVGYGVLGELYLAHGMKRQAQWNFIAVDTVYPADQDERVMALTRLVGIFAEVGDKDGEKSHADRFRERLQKAR